MILMLVENRWHALHPTFFKPSYCTNRKGETGSSGKHNFALHKMWSYFALQGNPKTLQYTCCGLTKWPEKRDQTPVHTANFTRGEDNTSQKNGPWPSHFAAVTKPGLPYRLFVCQTTLSPLQLAHHFKQPHTKKKNKPSWGI